MLQENNPDATRMSIPRKYYVPGILLHLRCKYMSVSKLVTAELLSLR